MPNTIFTQNINEISNDLDCKKFDYIGFSMGARAGFEAASKNIKLDKLISLGMHPGSPKLEEKRFIKRSNAMKNLGKKTNILLLWVKKMITII